MRPALRLSGPAAERARGRVKPPSGAVFRDDADDALAIALGPDDARTAEAIAEALPEPSTLEPGTFVVILGAVVTPPSLARSVLAAFGRAELIPRDRRCTALVARGFVDVGAGEDEGSRADLAWGYAPGVAGR